MPDYCEGRAETAKVPRGSGARSLHHALRATLRGTMSYETAWRCQISGKARADFCDLKPQQKPIALLTGLR